MTSSCCLNRMTYVENSCHKWICYHASSSSMLQCCCCFLISLLTSTTTFCYKFHKRGRGPPNTTIFFVRDAFRHDVFRNFWLTWTNYEKIPEVWSASKKCQESFCDFFRKILLELRLDDPRALGMQRGHWQEHHFARAVVIVVQQQTGLSGGLSPTTRSRIPDPAFGADLPSTFKYN